MKQGPVITYSGDNWEINVFRYQHSYFATVPDPEWEFVDAAGHTHRYVESDDTLTIPTTVREVKFEFEDEEGEVCQVHHTVCKECKQPITPGVKEIRVTKVVGPMEVEGWVTITPEQDKRMRELNPHYHCCGSSVAFADLGICNEALNNRKAFIVESSCADGEQRKLRFVASRYDDPGTNS